MRKPVFRRIFAYIIDIIVVALVAAALSSNKYLNPYYEKYRENEQKYQELIEEVSSDPNKLNEFLNSEEMTDLNYDLSKSGVFLSIYTVVISALYFVGFQYYTKGKTLGKLITKIEVVSNNKEKLNITQLIKRSIIINSLITSSLSAILIMTLSKTNYLNYSRYVQLVDIALILISVGFVIYREDGMGLHDLFGGTRVIYSEDKEFF